MADKAQGGQPAIKRLPEDSIGFAAVNVMQGVMTPEQALAYADGLLSMYKAEGS